MGCNANVPFPNNKLVFDLTDGISFVYPNTDNRIYIVCRDTVPDGLGGRIDSLSGTNINWGLTSISNETPAIIYDTLLSTFAGLYIGPNVSTNVGTISIDMADYINSGNVIPKATFRNCGTLPQSFPVTFQILQNSGHSKSIIYTSTQNISNLLPNTNLQVNFINWSSTVGNYTCKAFTQLVNDSLRINDTLSKNVGIFNIPGIPIQISPPNGQIGLEPTQTLQWSKVTGASTYCLMISTDSLFTNIFYRDSLSADTSRVFNLFQLTKYYWKVKAGNLAGSGIFSNIWCFKTKGMPSVPVRISPLNNSVNLSVPVLFRWNKSFDNTDGMYPIEKYLIEYATDTVSLSNYFLRIPLDTVWSEESLSSNTAYFWRISAKSNLGWSQKSNWWRFSTVSTGITKINGITPDIFDLYNNYPNPFNPSTSIKLDIPKNCFVILKIFDINGRQLDILLNNKMDAGSYILNYNAGNLPSGVYFYQLNTDNYIKTKKMILVK